MARLFIAQAVVLFLAACGEGYVSFPVTEAGQRQVDEDIRIIRLDPENIASFTRPSRGHQRTDLPGGSGWNYRVGPGDILTVIVFDHPELTLPTGPQRPAAESGFRVQADGSFFYPFIGQVRASGRAPEEIRAELSERLAEYIPQPQVEVRVAAYNSQHAVVTGAVGAPSRQSLTSVPLTLIEAINSAGGLSSNADPRAVTVQRGGRLYNVDLQGFLDQGISANNPVLRSGDVVNVPRRSVQEAYLLGEVRNPNVIDLSQEPVTLTQAIARQGGLNELRADARGIFVFRADAAGEMTVFQLETSSPSGMLLGTRFVLEPGDVIYIVRSPLQRWNDTIPRLLPTVRAVNVAEGLVD